MKPTNSANLQNIVGNYNTGGGNRMQFLLRAAPTRYEFFIGNGVVGGYMSVFSSSAPNFGNYEHVAGVWNGTVATLYVNGVVSGTTTITYPSFQNFAGANVVIGSNMIGENFNGDIDEVRLWNVARTKCQINTFMNCEIPTSSTGLMANYHFNHGVAAGNNTGITTLVDASGNGVNGTLTASNLTGPTSNWVAPGGVVSGYTTTLAPPSVSVTASPTFSLCTTQTVALTATAPANTTFTWSGGIANGVPFVPTSSVSVYSCNVTNTVTSCTGVTTSTVYISTCSGTPASALHFNGTDGVDLGTAISSSLTGSNKITVEAWVKPSFTGNFQNLVGNYSTLGSDNTQFLLRQNGANYEFWIGNSSVASYTNVNAANSVTVNAWQHVAGVWNGTVASVYVNGVLRGTANIGLTAFNSITNPVVIGTNLMNQSYIGSLDEVRIWKSARTACEINTYMNCEIPSGATNLLANYHFNQGFANGQNPTVTSLNDASGNNINGVLNTFALTGIASNWITPGGVTSGSTTPLPAPTINVSSTNSVACINTTQTITASGTPTLSWIGVCANCTSTVATATSSTTITYTVIGTAANTCTASTNFTQTFVSCTGIEELENTNNIVSVFPNPNNGQFNVTLNTNATLNIYNNLGQTVRTEKLESGNYTINISHLAKGIYMIEAVSGNQRQMHKVIVE